MIKEKFELLADEDLSLDKTAFEKLFKPTDIDEIFSLFDMDKSGRIDSYEFITALALLS